MHQKVLPCIQSSCRGVYRDSTHEKEKDNEDSGKDKDDSDENPPTPPADPPLKRKVQLKPHPAGVRSSSPQVNRKRLRGRLCYKSQGSGDHSVSIGAQSHREDTTRVSSPDAPTTSKAVDTPKARD